MSNPVPSSKTKRQQGLRGRSLTAIAALVVILGLFLLGKQFAIVDLEVLQEAIKSFADGPWGVPVLILTFCLSALIGIPQFVLIGVAVYAFGALWGAVFAWLATLCSGTLTYGIGRGFAQTVLKRYAGRGVKRLTAFIARNAFVASALVRNLPTGPFLLVNILFGAVGAQYVSYLSGMALGIIPKILLLAFGIQAIEAALGGHIWVALGAGLAAFGLFFGGFLYARKQRARGENIALSRD